MTLTEATERREKALVAAAALFKPWIVRRPHGYGGCQVLFPLTELDALVLKIAETLKAEGGERDGRVERKGSAGAEPGVGKGCP